jgi:Thioredoxin
MGKAPELFADAANVKELDATSWAEIKASSDVWLIDFYLPWCGHCQVSLLHSVNFVSCKAKLDCQACHAAF